MALVIVIVVVYLRPEPELPFGTLTNAVKRDGLRLHINHIVAVSQDGESVEKTLNFRGYARRVLKRVRIFRQTDGVPQRYTVLALCELGFTG